VSNIAISHTIRSDGIATLPLRAIALLERIPVAIPQLLFRFGMGLVFWRSADSKLASWDTTLLLFREEYKVPVLPPELAAYLATAVELTAPILLALGLATRLGAAAMLGMALVIQLFVYPQSYPDHLLWAGPLLYLIIRGPGTVSLDHLIRRHFERRAR
jgi:putative oxidoreductase